MFLLNLFLTHLYSDILAIVKSETIKFDGHIIQYYTYGKGSHTMLAFHGFGQDGTALAPVAKSLANQFTIYSFDIFYHGKSYWNTPDQPLSKDYLKRLITYFNQQKGVLTFSILAFSMGGKFALSIVENMSESIESVYLIAPDGIQTQRWYNLSTYPLVFQKYFQSMIVKPSRFFSIVNAVKRLRLVDKGLLKFAESQMDTVKKRRRVYYSWIIFQDLTFDLQEISNELNRHSIVVKMFLGEHDKIITEVGMNKLIGKLNHSKLHILNCGHNNLIEYTADFLNQKQ